MRNQITQQSDFVKIAILWARLPIRLNPLRHQKLSDSCISGRHARPSLRTCCGRFGEDLPKPEDRRFALLTNDLANSAAVADTIPQLRQLIELDVQCFLGTKARLELCPRSPPGDGYLATPANRNIPTCHRAFCNDLHLTQHFS